ncbi:MAG TPA: SIMPL domain-containing protein [Acidimicrobiales bacterium]|nr:SIMPL domain-containing protein [Acidimicrobiales bacterium]
MPTPPHTHVRRAALATVALLLLAGCSKAADAETKPAAKNERTVTVTATGTSKGVPDALLVNLSVTTGGPSADETLADNNRRTQKVLDQLKLTAVDDEDVATTSVDLGPTYDEDGTITGYAATNSLRITFRSLESAGAKLDVLVKGGDDHVRINGVQLGFTDDDELISTARIDAVKRAKTQAKDMAGAADAKVGKVRTITDVVPRDAYPEAYASSGRAMSADSSVPIAAGSEELEVQVKVVFELA